MILLNVILQYDTTVYYMVLCCIESYYMMFCSHSKSISICTVYHNQDGSLYLMAEAEGGSCDAVLSLLERGANVNGNAHVSHTVEHFLSSSSVYFSHSLFFSVPLTLFHRHIHTKIFRVTFNPLLSRALSSSHFLLHSFSLLPSPLCVCVCRDRTGTQH